jgi:hypothetical protein
MEEKYDKRKETWKEASKKYYDKIKPNIDRNVLTEEEKQEHIKISKAKYYQKIKELKPKVERKVLTEDEKITNKKIANKKYYDKLKNK